MTYYAIRHKPTGNMFPLHCEKGQTRLMFVSPFERPPRLWPQASGARRFLSVWCKGEMKIVTEFEPDGFGGKGYYYQAGHRHVPDPTRIKDEYEVVSCTLTIEARQ